MVRHIVIVAGLACATAITLSGQAVTGSILGTVTDLSSAVVPGSTVVLTETATNVSRSAKTNASGYYAFPDLPPGTYRVSVERTGFATTVQEGIELAANHTVRADCVLQVGTASSTVRVQAAATELVTDRADVSYELDQKEVQDLPLTLNRNYMGLIALLPGAQRPSRPSSQNFNPQDTESFNAQGSNIGGQTIQIEGLSDDQDIGYQSTYVPPEEAIEAVNVSMSNYDAELGHAANAVVNVTLRSGTNQWHGSLYEFLQNDITSARNFFAYPTTTVPNPVAPLRYNLFGGTIGGPIRKNKLFVFGDYQALLKHAGTIQVATLPSAAWRQGNLSSSTSTIFDPDTGNPDGTGRQPFSGNIIPASRLSPVMQKIIADIPLPNLLGLINNFSEPNVLMKTSHTFDIKADWVPRTADHFTVRYSGQNAYTTDPPLYFPAGGPNVFATTQSPQYIVQPDIEHTHIFSPTLISETRIGFTRWANTAKQYDYGMTEAKDLGIAGLNTTPFTSGFPSIDWTGATTQLTGYSNSLPWFRGENHYEVVSNWTKIAGSHLIKWGVDFRRIQEFLLSASNGNPRGDYVYSQGTTGLPSNSASLSGIGNSFASILLDLPSSINRVIIPILPAMRQTNIFAFVQDKWQVTKKLTFDLGLRWEDWPFVTPASPGGFAQYDPTTNNIELAGWGKIPLNFGVPNNYRFQPRLGLAYRISHKTVFRAGYGITTPSPNLWVNLVGYNYPVAQVNNFNQANPYGPAIGPSGPLSLGGGMPPPQVAVFPSNGLVPANTSILNSTAITNLFEPDYKIGYLQFWNAAVQRELPDKFFLTVMYTGNKSFGYGGSYNLNASLPGTGQAGQPLFQKFGRTAATSIIVEGSNSPHFEALEVKGDRSFAQGLLSTTAFTWSKVLSCNMTNQFNPREFCGPTAVNQKFNFVQGYLYELPFGAGKRWFRSGPASWLVGGWQVNGIFTVASGLPSSYSAPANLLNGVGLSQVPNCLYAPKILGGIGPGHLYFDTSAFALPPAATFGNCGPNTLVGPGFVNLDASVFRKFKVTERIAGELRAESFNLSNTPHFSSPNTTFGNASFGQITAAAQDQRTFQFGVKLKY